MTTKTVATATQVARDGYDEKNRLEILPPPGA